MSDPSSARHILPLLAVAQAQKEITHNEALIRVDALLHPVVEDILEMPPEIASPDAGKSWLVDAAPSGEWTGKSNQIAYWTGENWRYLAPVEAMRIWNKATDAELQWTDIQWVAGPSISAPSGGAVVDAEARTALAGIINYLRASGRLTS